MARAYARKKTRGSTSYGKPFTTKRGRYGRYKYVNGRRVSFETISRRKSKSRKRSTYRRRK